MDEILQCREIGSGCGSLTTRMGRTRKGLLPEESLREGRHVREVIRHYIDLHHSVVGVKQGLEG
jgi:hypothetical protein